MKKILLIDDDFDVYQLLKYNLEKAGFQFVGANTGHNAINLCLREQPDLVLLDIMLPDSSGLEICCGIRSHRLLSETPIIFLTARASEADRIMGLESGANDYIVKPFSIREVIARIRAHLRSVVENAPAPSRLGSLELDRSRFDVRKNGHLVQLTATEFRLLEFLMRRPGVVFSREELVTAAWEDGRSVANRGVDVYILRLRKKLEFDPAHPQFIVSVRGFGYTFDPERNSLPMDLLAANV